MNEPHERICPECGKYMKWKKDHYECQCGYISRFQWTWKIGITILTIFAAICFITIRFY